MGILLTVNEKPRKGTGQGSTREYTREWEVKWSDGTATEAIATAAVSVSLGQAHPDDATAYAFKATGTQQDDVCYWIVSIDYKTGNITNEEREKWSTASPLLRPAKVSCAWESKRVPVPCDTNGDVIKNSAGDVPIPRIEEDAESLVFTISKCVNPIPTWVDTYRGKYGTINNAIFKIEFENGQTYQIKKGCGRLKNVRVSELKSENNVDFFDLSFQIYLREPPPSDTSKDGWAYEFVDMGKRAIGSGLDPSIGITLELLPILDESGQPVTDPVLLDGSGNPLAKPSTDVPVIFYKDIFDAKTFANVLPGCVL